MREYNEIYSLEGRTLETGWKVLHKIEPKSNRQKGKYSVCYMVEKVKSGTVHLVGTNHDLIVNEVSTLLDDAVAYEKMSKAVNPYGDGKACNRIVRALNGEAVDCYEVQ